MDFTKRKKKKQKLLNKTKQPRTEPLSGERRRAAERLCRPSPGREQRRSGMRQLTLGALCPLPAPCPHTLDDPCPCPRAVRGRIPAAASPQRKVTRCGVRDSREKGRRERRVPRSSPGRGLPVACRSRVGDCHFILSAPLLLHQDAPQPLTLSPGLFFFLLFSFSFFFHFLRFLFIRGASRFLGSF